MKLKNLLTLSVFVFLAILLLSSCAEVQNVETCKTGHTYGFLGGWYSFGFLIGVGSLGLGGSKASRRK